MNVVKFSSDDVPTWWQPGELQIRIGDVLDHTSEAAMSVGFARYRKGEANPWTLTYDEALIVTKGVFTVRTAEGAVTAGVGEVIYLPAGAQVVYQADEEAEVVYVTHPHWYEATQRSPQAANMAEYRQLPTS